MTAEELQQKLDELPAPASDPPQRAAAASLGAATQRALSTLRLVSPRLGAEDSEAERRRLSLDARKRRISERRAELAPRLRHQELAAALRKHDTCCALLLGPSGVGKTGAALWAAVRHRGLWVQARDLGACERRHPLGEGVPPLMQAALSARVLYIDDLGTEDSRDLGVLQYVIDRRYAAGLAMFVTCGLDQQGASAYLGAPYVRRIVQQHVPGRDGAEWPVLFVDCFEATP